MNEQKFRALLEEYSLEDILDRLELEPVDVLIILFEAGYDFESIVEPIDSHG